MPIHLQRMEIYKVLGGVIPPEVKAIETYYFYKSDRRLQPIFLIPSLYCLVVFLAK